MIRRDVIAPLLIASFAMAFLAGSVSPVRADLLGYWPADLGIGEVALNGVAGAAVGTINKPENGLGPGGSVWIDDATRGTVLSFDGSADGAYVRAGEIPQMTLDNDFTWAFWSNQDVDNTSSNDIIFGNRKDENANDFVPRQFIKFTPTKFEWHMNGNGNDNLDYDDIPSGEWVYNVVTKQGAELTYYRNGVEGGTQTITQALDVPQPLFFGGDNEGSSGENWRGMIDDVAIWDEAISVDLINDLANGVVKPGPSPVPAIFGDFNADGVIDSADFNILADNFLVGNTHATGDINFSQNVDLQDFVEFVAAFDQANAGAAVPEPSSVVLVLLGLATLLCGRFTRGNRKN